MKENVCKKCDKTFYAKVQKTHCSDKCKQTECKLCNKKYIQKNGEKFCGEECTKKYYTHTCKACEKEFFKKAEKAVFCSKECKENISKVQKKHKVCKNCKKIILVLDESVSFCNAECSQEYRRNKQLKAKNKKTDEEILEIVTKRVDILLERKKKFLEEGMFATIDYWKVDGFTYDLKQN